MIAAAVVLFALAAPPTGWARNAESLIHRTVRELHGVVEFAGTEDLPDVDFSPLNSYRANLVSDGLVWSFQRDQRGRPVLRSVEALSQLSTGKDNSVDEIVPDLISDPLTLEQKARNVLDVLGISDPYGDAETTYTPTQFLTNSEGRITRLPGTIGIRLKLLREHACFEGYVDVLLLVLDPHNGTLVRLVNWKRTVVVGDVLILDEATAEREARAYWSREHGQELAGVSSIELGFGLAEVENERRRQAHSAFQELSPDLIRSVGDASLAHEERMAARLELGQRLKSQSGREDGIVPIELTYRVWLGSILLNVSATTGRVWETFEVPEPARPVPAPPQRPDP